VAGQLGSRSCLFLSSGDGGAFIDTKCEYREEAVVTCSVSIKCQSDVSVNQMQNVAFFSNLASLPPVHRIQAVRDRAEADSTFGRFVKQDTN